MHNFLDDLLVCIRILIFRALALLYFFLQIRVLINIKFISECLFNFIKCYSLNISLLSSVSEYKVALHKIS